MAKSDRITKDIGKPYPDIFRGTKVTTKITVRTAPVDSKSSPSPEPSKKK